MNSNSRLLIQKLNVQIYICKEQLYAIHTLYTAYLFSLVQLLYSYLWSFFDNEFQNVGRRIFKSPIGINPCTYQFNAFLKTFIDQLRTAVESSRLIK